jgi:hypothetical protein
MKLFFILAIAHLSYLSSIAQINLVPNGGFEDLSECPYTASMTEIPGVELASNWWNCTNFNQVNYGSSNIFNLCVDSSLIQYIQNYYIGNQTPFQGNGFAGFYAYSEPINPFGGGNSSLWGEYLSCELTDNIYPGKNYLLSFQISLSQVFANYNLKYLNVAFFSDSIKSSGISFIQDDINVVFPENANYEFFQISGLDTVPFNSWFEIQIIINPINVSSHIALGTFKSNYTIFHEGEYVYSHEPTGLNNLELPTTYYLIDNISLTEIVDTTSIADINKAKIKIYPNPFDKFISINGLNEEDYIVKFYDLSSRLIYETRIKGIENIQISTEHIQNGAYFLEVSSINGKRIITEKIIK